MGFGDIVPNTYCGRGIAVSVGITVSYNILRTHALLINKRNDCIYFEFFIRTFFSVNSNSYKKLLY